MFSLNGTGVCSKQVYTKAQLPSQYLLDNSTEISQNYTATLYSLVNRTQYGYSAQVSSSYLIYYLNISGKSLAWNSNIKNTCHFSKAIGCSVASFNNVNSTALLNLTNNLNASIRINKIGCFVPGFESNYSVNKTLTNGQSAVVAAYCIGRIPGSIFSPVLNFNLTINYTEYGNLQYATGLMNVSNSGS